MLVDKLEKLRSDALKPGAGLWDRARLEGVAAPHAGAWLDAPPSRVQDMLITNAEIHSRVGRRLGVALCEEMACPFCFCTLDKWGSHAESCMSGGIRQHPTIVSEIDSIFMQGGQGRFQCWRRQMF